MASWFEGGLFLASLLPVVKLVLLCACGALAARKGILDDKGRRNLNLVVFWIFTPALIFATLGGVFSFTNLKRLWMIPVNILMSYPIGIGIGWALTAILRCPKEIKLHVILAVSMGNTGNMPFLFVLALCGDSRTPFPGALGSQCQTLGYGYVALGTWVAAIFQFALAFSLLKQGGDKSAHPGIAAPPQANSGLQQTDEAPTESQVAREVALQPVNGSAEHGSITDKALLESMDSAKEANRIKTLLTGNLQDTEERNAELQKRQDLSSPSTSLSEEEPGSMQDTRGEQQGVPHQSLQPASSAGAVVRRADGWHQRFSRRLWKELKEFQWSAFYTPPLVGCYLAFFVGAIPGVRHLFFGNSRALGFVTDTLMILGNSMIPSALLVVGAVLQKGPSGKAVVPYRILVGVVIARLLIIPVAGIAILYGMASAGVFYIPDPLYFFLLLLMYMMPTSYNLQTMATLHKNGEQEMGAMIFWVYICAMPVLPFFILYSLHLSTIFPRS